MTDLNLPLETLARLAPDVAVGDEAADSIAALALLISLEQARVASMVVPPRFARSYSALDEHERAGMRANVRRIIQALVLLGWIEAP
jgi:hypothetical protein